MQGQRVQSRAVVGRNEGVRLAYTEKYCEVRAHCEESKETSLEPKRRLIRPMNIPHKEQRLSITRRSHGIDGPWTDKERSH